MTGKAEQGRAAASSQTDRLSAVRRKATEARIKKLAKEACAPELAELRERVAALEAKLDGDAPAEPEDRSARIERWVDAGRFVAWLDSEVGRPAVNAALGNRSTASRWAKGKSKKTERDRAEKLLSALGRVPIDLADALGEGEGEAT